MEIVSKTKLMGAVGFGRLHESFEHSEQGMFDITATRHAIELQQITYEIVWIDFDQFIDFAKKHRVFEEERVASLTDTSWKLDPGIFATVEEPDGTISHMMLDGIHRAVRRQREGEKGMRFYMIAEKDAKRPTEDFVQNPFYDWSDQIIKDGVITRRGKV